MGDAAAFLWKSYILAGEGGWKTTGSERERDREIDLYGTKGRYMFMDVFSSTCEGGIYLALGRNRPIRTRYLCHVTGYQPIRDQYFPIRSVPDIWPPQNDQLTPCS
eukprot:sb/3477768/